MLAATRTTRAVTAMKPLGQATCPLSQRKVRGPSQRPTPRIRTNTSATRAMLMGRLVALAEPDGAMSLKMMANNVQLTRSSTMVAVMHMVPIPPFSKPRSIRIRASTGLAELARFMPTNRANAKKWA